MTSPLNEEIKKEIKNKKGEGKETSREEGERERGSSMECFQAGRCNGTCSAIQHVPRKVNTQISQRWTHDQRCDTDSNNHFSFFSWRRGISQYNVSCRESNISCLLGTGVLVLLYIYELHSPVLYSHLQKSWVKSNETLWKVNFYFDVSSIFENA